MTETRRLLGVLVALSAIAIVFAAGVVVVVLVQDDEQNAAHPLTEVVADALDVESASELSGRRTGSALTDEHREYAEDLVEEGTITEEQAEELLDWWGQAPEWVGSIQRSDESEDLEYTFRFAPFAGFRNDSESPERFEWSEEFDFEDLLSEDFADRLDEWFSELEDGSFQDELDDSKNERRFWFGRRSFDELPDRYGWTGEDDGAEWLDDLFEEGLFTAEGEDEIREWLEDLPDSFEFNMEDFPGDGSFEFDSDDGRFRFRGHWRMDEREWGQDGDGGAKKDDDNGDGISFRNPSF